MSSSTEQKSVYRKRFSSLCANRVPLTMALLLPWPVAANGKAHQRHRYRIQFIVFSMEFHGHGKPTMCVLCAVCESWRHLVEEGRPTICCFGWKQPTRNHKRMWMLSTASDAYMGCWRICNVNARRFTSEWNEEKNRELWPYRASRFMSSKSGARNDRFGRNSYFGETEII